MFTSATSHIKNSKNTVNHVARCYYYVTGASRAYQNVLVVMKQTPYQQYAALKAQGKAPVALRWERLLNRDKLNTECAEQVRATLEKCGTNCVVVRRDELHRGLVQGKDLVVAVGGDGTVLNSSSFLDDTIPLLGINSDPTRPEDMGGRNIKDERRSRGSLCSMTVYNQNEFLPKAIYGEISPGLRSRIQCVIRSTYTETRLPPALNDILLAHPTPAAVSRFRLSMCSGNIEQTYAIDKSLQEVFSLNVWSSGIWVSTATGSTAAMYAAGGQVMDPRSSSLQYKVREHLIEDETFEMEKQAGHGMIMSNEMLYIRWSSQFGAAYVDGSHMKHDLELGDEIELDGHAPYLKLFDPVDHPLRTE